MLSFGTENNGHSSSTLVLNPASMTPTLRKPPKYAGNFQKAAHKEVLTPQTKKMIMECPLHSYTADKIRYRDSTKLHVERKRIRNRHTNSGWCSDPREPYKPLGKLELDTETLIRDTLKLGEQSKNYRKEEYEAVDEISVQENIVMSTGTVGSDFYPSQSNGYDLLKAKIAKSKSNVATVKAVPILNLQIGTPFTHVLSSENEQEKLLLRRKEALNSQKSKEIDWKNLRIDKEKQAYYQGLFEKKNRPLIDRNIKKPKSTSRLESGTRKPLAAAGYVGSAAKARMEQALDIHPDNTWVNSSRQFLESRDKCYEQRLRLTNLLTEDLNRFERNRQETFKRKFNAFDVQKKTGFVDELKTMRRRNSKELKQKREEKLNSHPWYNELAKRVEMTSGGSKKTHFEALLLRRIRGFVEDDVDFTQQTFVKFLKVIPRSAFVKEEIQRIIRFVKQNIDTLTEKDYVDSLEMAGHQLFLE